MTRLLVMLIMLLHFELSEATLPVQDLSSFYCMLENVYHEARGEPIEGIMAVNMVVLNRSKQSSKTICETIAMPKQFSWRSDPEKLKTVVRVDTQLELSAAVWSAIYGGHPEGQSGQLAKRFRSAYFYHSIKVKPKWAAKMKKIGRIGNHIFYERSI